MDIQPPINTSFLGELVHYLYFLLAAPVGWFVRWIIKNLADIKADIGRLKEVDMQKALSDTERFVTRKEYYRDQSQAEKRKDERHKEIMDFLRRLEDRLEKKADK